MYKLGSSLPFIEEFIPENKKSMTLNAFRWLKGLWPTRRSRRLHPIDDRVANARNFFTMNLFGGEIDDVPNLFPTEINQRVALNSNLIQRVEISDCLEIKCCSICLEDFEIIDYQVVRLPCLHIFHEICIAKWLGAKSNVNCSCPLCRSQYTAYFLLNHK